MIDEVRALCLLVLGGCFVGWLVGCYADSPPIDPMVTSRVEYFDVPLTTPRQIDLLVVVDNSAAMANYEATWLVNTGHFMNLLERIAGGLHIGVITTDVETDGGRLRTVDGVQGTFISSIKLANGVRQTNYTGELADAFTELATVGTNGGTARPLDAMRAAIGDPTNAGFVRHLDTHLAVVIITPSDDPGSDDLDDIAAVLRATKSDPSEVTVSVVSSPSSQRLHAFTYAFPNRSTFTSIEGENWTDGVSLFGDLRQPLGNPCLMARLADLDPEMPGLQPECTVSYRFRDFSERIVPGCAGANPPCWRVVEDPLRCSVTPHRAIDVVHGAEVLPRGTHVVGNCLVE